MENRQGNITLLRIFSTFAVVWLHVNGTIWGNQDLFPITMAESRFYAVNHYIMYWAVPCFFMITGCLLLSKPQFSYRECYCKYLRRIILSILIFGYGYSLIRELSETGFKISIFLKAITDVLTFHTFSHLWYLYELVGIYLLIPFLKRMIDKLTKRELEVLLFVLFTFDYLIPFLGVITKTSPAFYVQFSYSLFYLLLGYYLKHYVKPETGFYIVSGLTAMILAGIISYNDPVPGNHLLEYNSPIIAAAAASIFSFFMCKKEDLKELVHKKAVVTIERACFGIYLVHPFFIQFFYRILKITPGSFGHYFVGSVVMFMIVSALSFITAGIMTRIPGLKSIV